MKFSWLFCFRYNFSLTNSTQFGNDSNYSKFNGENIATNSPRFKVGSHDPISIQLTLKIFVCVMEFVDVHTIQFLHPMIS